MLPLQRGGYNPSVIRFGNPIVFPSTPAATFIIQLLVWLSLPVETMRRVLSSVHPLRTTKTFTTFASLFFVWHGRLSAASFISVLLLSTPPCRDGTEEFLRSTIANSNHFRYLCLRQFALRRHKKTQSTNPAPVEKIRAGLHFSPTINQKFTKR